MNKEAKFIAIHGIDGTGKTTTVDVLTKEMIAQGRKAINYDEIKEHLIVNPFSFNKKEVVERCGLEPQFLHFVASKLFQSENIRVLVKGGASVIKDRWMLDVVGHFTHLGIKNTHIVEDFDYLRPDFTVLLVLEEEERKRRLVERPDSKKQDFDFERASFLQAFLHDRIEPLVRENKAVIIDTGKASPGEVVTQIMRLI